MITALVQLLSLLLVVGLVVWIALLLVLAYALPMAGLRIV